MRRSGGRSGGTRCSCSTARPCARALAGLSQPRLEPEVVFGLKAVPRAGMDNAAIVGCIKPAGYNPRFGILFDMVGDTYLEIPREGYSERYARDVNDLVWRTAAELGVSQFVQRVGSLVDDDHLPLNEAGIKTIDLIDFDYPAWHTTADTPENCSAESLEAVGRVMLAWLRSQRLG